MDTNARITAAIKADSQGRLANPNVLQEDDPPMLRFERGTIKDPVQSEERGIYVPMDCIYVHVRAFGDIKNEVPYVAEKTVYIPTIEQILIEKTVPITVHKEDKEGNRTEDTRYETKEVLEDRATYIGETASPWIITLKDRLNNGKITQNYYQHCIRSFEAWKETGDIPVDGYPVIEWKMISAAQQERLLAIGLNSVEKVSEMTEDGMESYGMGARDLKKKAVEYLLAGTDQSKSAARIISLETKADNDREEMSRLQQKLAELTSKFEAQQGEPKEEINDNSIPGTEDS